VAGNLRDGLDAQDRGVEDLDGIGGRIGGPKVVEVIDVIIVRHDVSRGHGPASTRTLDVRAV
jgi:hypothetical protein